MDKNLRGNTMKKIIILINVILSLIFITGCTNNDIVLNTDEKYYNISMKVVLWILLERKIYLL